MLILFAYEFQNVVDCEGYNDIIHNKVYLCNSSQKQCTQNEKKIKDTE